MASIQATRLKKGMLVKIEQDLFRVLELQHVTPGNLRGFVRVKFRNIRSGSLSDQKLRSEDTVERATLDESEMQYLYKDGDSYYFMDTTLVRAGPHLERGAGRLGELPEARDDDQGRVLRHRAGRDRAAADCGPEGDRHGARHQGRHRQQPGEAGDARNRARRQVPPFINTGDSVRVSTETGEYLARVGPRSRVSPAESSPSPAPRAWPATPATRWRGSRSP